MLWIDHFYQGNLSPMPPWLILGWNCVMQVKCWNLKDLILNVLTLMAFCLKPMHPGSISWGLLECRWWRRRLCRYGHLVASEWLVLTFIAAARSLVGDESHWSSDSIANGCLSRRVLPGGWHITAKVMDDTAASIQDRLPKPFPLDVCETKFPTRHRGEYRWRDMKYYTTDWNISP